MIIEREGFTVPLVVVDMVAAETWELLGLHSKGTWLLSGSMFFLSIQSLKLSAKYYHSSPFANPATPKMAALYSDGSVNFLLHNGFLRLLAQIWHKSLAQI